MAASLPSGQDGSDRDHDLGDAVTEERPGIERPVTPVPHSVFSVSNVAPKDRFVLIMTMLKSFVVAAAHEAKQLGASGATG